MSKIYVVVEDKKKIILSTTDDPAIENTIVVNRLFGDQQKATLYSILGRFESYGEFITLVEYSVAVKAYQG